MSVATLKRLDPTAVELEISIPPEMFASEEERAFRQLVRNAKIPGFRPGKAPRKVFEAQYGHGVIHERALERVVPQAYSQAVREHDLEPVDQPQLELLPHEEGEPLRLRATVAVRPPIELGAYRGIAVPRTLVEVDDAAIDRTIESLRREAATLVPVDRPVELDDVATLDYEGFIDGVPFEGGKAENAPTEVRADRFIPGFVEGIVGMKSGESKSIEATFPADYSNADLAGKTATFTVRVHDVKKAELPELDDAFAARFRAGATVEDMRADIRGRLEQQARSNARRAESGAIMEHLLATHEFSLPPVLVERETESIVGEAKRSAAQMGLEWDAYLEMSGKSEESIGAEARGEAERRVRSTLLLEAIAKSEKIEATAAEIDAEVAVLAAQYGQPKEKIVELLRPNFGSLVDGIVRSKTLEFLLEHADFREDGGNQTAGAEVSSE